MFSRPYFFYFYFWIGSVAEGNTTSFFLGLTYALTHLNLNLNFFDLSFFFSPPGFPNDAKPRPYGFGMLELSALIAGPICLICIGIILLLTVRQFQLRRQAPQMVRIPMYPEDPENPLMPQQCTLRDLCNQSTSSGSGSGMFMSLSVCPSVCLSVFKTGSSSHWVTLVSGRFRKPTHATSVHVKGSVQPIYILWFWIRYVYVSVCPSVCLFICLRNWFFRSPLYPEGSENPLMPHQCTLRDLCNQSTSSGSGSGMFMSLSVCLSICPSLCLQNWYLKLLGLLLYPGDPENPLMPQQCTLRDLCNQSTSLGSGSGTLMSLSVRPSVCWSVFKTGSSSHWGYSCTLF